MIDIKQLQKDIYQNKLDKGFNVTDINGSIILVGVANSNYFFTKK